MQRRVRAEGYAPQRWLFLLDVIERLCTVQHFEDILEVLRSAARRLAVSDGITIVLREGDLCHYIAEDAIAPHWKGQRFPLSACISGWCMLHQATVVVPDIYADGRIPHDAYCKRRSKNPSLKRPIRSVAPE